jgi:hypothetical protein
MRKQAVNKLLTAIGARVGEKLLDFTYVRDSARQIQIKAAHEFGVRRRGDRVNAVGAPHGGKLLIDAACELSVRERLVKRLPLRDLRERRR